MIGLSLDSDSKKDSDSGFLAGLGLELESPKARFYPSSDRFESGLRLAKRTCTQFSQASD